MNDLSQNVRDSSVRGGAGRSFEDDEVAVGRRRRPGVSRVHRRYTSLSRRHPHAGLSRRFRQYAQGRPRSKYDDSATFNELRPFNRDPFNTLHNACKENYSKNHHHRLVARLKVVSRLLRDANSRVLNTSK